MVTIFLEVLLHFLAGLLDDHGNSQLLNRHPRNL
jgi:hypothetical protein